MSQGRNTDQRVGVFVDVQNMYYSSKNLYNKKVNFQILLKEAIAGRRLVKGACASMNRIIGDLPKTIPTAHVISSAGCAGRADRLHFTPAGYRELGKRYAETLLPLLGNKKTEVK